MSIDASKQFIDQYVTKEGFDEYTGCLTGEVEHPTLRGQARRPCPNYAPHEGYQNLSDLFEEFAPHLYRFLAKRLKAQRMTYDSRSRLGMPFDEIVTNKLESMRPFWERFLRDDLSFFRRSDVYVITNKRLQPESKKKKRTMPYITDGIYTTKPFDAETRYMKDYDAIGSRVRIVYNYPGPANLYTQVTDKMLTNIYAESPFAHHNMPAKVGSYEPYHMLFIDVKHFERAAGVVLPLRAHIIGGQYGEMMREMLNLKVLSLGLDGYTYYTSLKKPVTFSDAGVQQGPVFMQLGSGLSCVSNMAKELLHVLYAAYYVKKLGYDVKRAFEIVFEGGAPHFMIMNFGDDNAIGATETEDLRDLYAFLGEYLPIEPEIPARFLGYGYAPWGLPLKSYVINLCFPERGPLTFFRRWPWFGDRERDADYRDLAQDTSIRRAIDEKYALLKQFGYEYAWIRDEAAREEREIDEYSIQRNRNFILGKEYLLTDEEKERDENYLSLGVDRVSQLLRVQLGGSALEQKRYR
jgi:hypothetical protein